MNAKISNGHRNNEIISDICGKHVMFIIYLKSIEIKFVFSLVIITKPQLS
jgi:hypothetical protein